MNKAGEWGEIYVNRYLREKGYEILTANYRCRFGEADIIFKDGKTLVLVEVKARTASMLATPAEYVTAQKQKKLVLTAASFMRAKKLDCPVRFDVAEVYFKSEDFKEYRINYISDAFRVR